MSVNIKPLEWVEIEQARSTEDPTTEPTGDYEAADGLGMFYYIRCYFGSDSYGWEVTHAENFVSDHDDPEAAKASAYEHHQRNVLSRISALEPQQEEAVARPCTCHPDDNPPVPCAQRFALTDCQQTLDAPYWAVWSESGAHIGLWQDRTTAFKIWQEYPNGKVLPLYHAPVQVQESPTVSEETETVITPAGGKLVFSGNLSDPTMRKAIAAAKGSSHVE